MGVTGSDSLRVAGLSRLTRVSVPTIKFYLRSGLLHAGERTGPNQMRYDESHVRRLRVIRALIDHGGLSVAAVAELVGGPGERTVPRVLDTIAQRTSTVDATGAARARWRDRLDAVLAQDDRRIDEDNPAAEEIVDVLVGMEVAGHAPDDALLAAYLRAGETVAAAEADRVRGAGQTRECAERLVVSIVLGAAALVAARRLGHDLVRPRD